MNNKQLAVLTVTLLGVITMLSNDAPKGIRNNNPLNIRHDDINDWVGKIGVDNDGFVIFDTPENGYRAAAKILKTYANRGLITIEQIVSTWAPGNENDTESYIASISSSLGMRRNDVVYASNYVSLLGAMTIHENGLNPYSQDTITNGVRSA